MQARSPKNKPKLRNNTDHQGVQVAPIAEERIMHQPMQGAGAMAPKPKNDGQGWGVPANTKKAHYFINGCSLCRRWMFLGWVEDNRHDHPDNCKACMKARASIAKAKGGAA